MNEIIGIKFRRLENYNEVLNGWGGAPAKPQSASSTWLAELSVNRVNRYLPNLNDLFFLLLLF